MLQIYKVSFIFFITGEFKSPLAELVPGVLPPESVTAHFQAVLPHTWSGRWKPLVVHFAGTGDHFFWRRRTLMAKPMIKERNIGSIILGDKYFMLIMN